MIEHSKCEGLWMTALLVVMACTAKPDSAPDTVAVSVPVQSAPTVGPSDTATRKAGPAPKTLTPNPQPAARDPQPAPSEDQGVVVAPTLAAVDTTITIRANGTELMFDPATITLKQGTRVRMRFVNMGTFAHNFVIVRDENDLDEMIQRAHDATDNVPMSMKAKMIAYSNIAQPTRTVETAFVVPAPGDYTYVCLVEGHANTMVGRLRSTP
jgi:plastocyanin